MQYCGIALLSLSVGYAGPLTLVALKIYNFQCVLLEKSNAVMVWKKIAWERTASQCKPLWLHLLSFHFLLTSWAKASKNNKDHKSNCSTEKPPMVLLLAAEPYTAPPHSLTVGVRRVKVRKSVGWDKDSLIGNAKAPCRNKGINSPLAMGRWGFSHPRKAGLYHAIHLGRKCCHSEHPPFFLL